METSAKVPPATPPIVKTEAAADPVICPETQQPCTRGCELKPFTGRTYCVVWVEKIKAAEVSRRENK